MRLTHTPATPTSHEPLPDLTSALLRELDLFAGLPDDDIELLALSFERVTVRPGQTLETQDAPVHRWSVIVEGHAVIERDATPIGLVGRGQSWSEHSILNQLRSSIGVVALSPVTLLTMTQRQFFAIPEHHPVLAGRLVARSATSADRLALPAHNALRHLSQHSA
jgi:CRP-like cAMP-binding protein